MTISLNAGELFARAVGHLSALAVGGVEKNEQLRLCKEARTYILELAAKTEKAVGRLNLQSQGFEQNLERLHREQVKQTNQLQSLETALRKLDAKIVGYRSREADLNRDIEGVEREINSVQKRIEEERKTQRNIRIAGLLTFGVAGLLATSAITSLVQQRGALERSLSDLRRGQNKLADEKREVEQKLERRRKGARDLEEGLGRLKESISVQDSRIKECGANLTKVRNLALQLKEMLEKYRFLGLRVEEIRDAVELDILDMNDVVGARKELEAIQQSEVAKRYLISPSIITIFSGRFEIASTREPVWDVYCDPSLPIGGNLGSC